MMAAKTEKLSDLSKKSEALAAKFDTQLDEATEQINKAFDLGAHAVVIGSAITRPQLITKRFINGVEEKYRV